MMQNSERLKVFEIPIETTLVFNKQNQQMDNKTSPNLKASSN